MKESLTKLRREALEEWPGFWTGNNIKETKKSDILSLVFTHGACSGSRAVLPCPHGYHWKLPFGKAVHRIPLCQCLKLGRLTSPQAQLLETSAVSQSPSLKLGPFAFALKRETEAAHIHTGVRIPSALEDL